MQKIIVPPIKCQGIKTKLIPFLKDNIDVNDKVWIEPFLGSGVVLFNIQPQKAIVSDKNKYIINFYKDIQNGTINKDIVRNFLEYHGELLSIKGDTYYKKMRTQFNTNHDPLYFLFLNRSCFNGMIRFNKKGEFNVPFCKKNNRFSKAYITKICNQVDNISKIIEGKEWKFVNCDWKETINAADNNSIVFLDPPYIGRNTTYIDEWNEEDAIELATISHLINSDIYLTMWKENQYRKNDYLYDYWRDFIWYEKEHFYHIGGSEKNRHPIIEVLATNKQKEF